MEQGVGARCDPSQARAVIVASRPLRPLTPFISALALAVYLAAVFLPCEPPDGFVAPGLASSQAFPVSGHAVAEAAPRRAGGPEPMEHVGHSGHAAHAAHGGHGTHDAHAQHDAHSTHGMSGQAAHSADHAGHEMPAAVEVEPAKRPRRLARSEMTAKCLCGCSDTRAFVGGGGARLGSVVPPAEVASLPEAIVSSASDRVLRSIPRVDPISEPIPI